MHAQLLKTGIMAPITFVGVEHDFEAALNLIDQIDAIGEEPGGIVVNVAPRDGEAHTHGNGTMFACFQYKQIWIISTIGGLTLSLVKKLHLTESLFVIHAGDAIKRMAQNGFIPEQRVSEIVNSQFRSFDFAPRVLAYVLSGRKLCCTETPIESIISEPSSIIAVIDCFGNGKTTILARELKVAHGNVQTVFGALPFYERLADVPDGTVAVVKGSSGLPGQRFAEIVINGGKAAEQLGFKVGDKVL